MSAAPLTTAPNPVVEKVRSFRQRILFSSVIDEQAEQTREAPCTGMRQHLPAWINPNRLGCRGSGVQLRLRISTYIANEV